MLISLTSLHGSPGVSTATLALTWVWPRHAVTAECDPTGGQALGVFDPDGIHGRRGVFEMMLEARSQPLHRAMSGQMLTLPDGTGRHHLLPGPGSQREAESLEWRRLTELFLSLETVDVLADCGRLRARVAPRAVLDAADLDVVLVRNCRSELRALASSLDVLREETGALSGDDALVVVVADPDPGVLQRFPEREIAQHFSALGVPVVGTLPWDPVSAAQLSDRHAPGRKFETAPLMNHARELAKEIGRRAMDRMNRLRGTGDRSPGQEAHRVR